VGADRVVVGTLQLEDDTLIVHARSIALESGRVQANVTERGPLQDLYATFARVARAIEPKGTASHERLTREHPPIAAFENYIKGLLAETPANAVNFLNAALKLHPTFDLARLALWDVYTDQGEHERALAALSSVDARSPQARAARFRSGLSELDL